MRGLPPKYYPDDSIGALKPHYLRPWTLRVRVSHMQVGTRMYLFERPSTQTTKK